MPCLGKILQREASLHLCVCREDKEEEGVIKQSTSPPPPPPPSSPSPPSRAELLRYSQSLRDSSAASTLLLPKPIHPHNNNQQQHTSNAVAVRRNRNYARTPDCLGNWRILIPNFLRSFTIPKGKKEKKEKKKQKQRGPTTNKMKALINSFEIPKKLSITKMLSTLRKRR
ncbi:hypothetical protein LWI29_021360 [Acer saccharum]|uniref:Uncharacterized protein n=1 Tax=Acer saccharum TaxID=4024 RepID=A0AA39VQA0_ACESA|nr:hypothetical protein LWI29_021360 [Acer saccharum]